MVLTDDGDAVAEVLDVLPGGVKAVEVVEITEGAEEVVGTAHLQRCVKNSDQLTESAEGILKMAVMH